MWYNIPRHRYHQLTRANTPVTAPFRRFFPFSPWRAPASLRLKNQKSLEKPSLTGAKQFGRSRNVSRQEKARREYWRIARGLDAVWAHFGPSKPRSPLSTDGNLPITCPALGEHVNIWNIWQDGFCVCGSHLAILYIGAEAKRLPAYHTVPSRKSHNLRW